MAETGSTAAVDELARLAEVFKMLGDPTRMRLLIELRDAEELCVGELATATDASESAVSQALRLLRTARIVAVRRDGRHMRYRLDDEHVRLLLDTARTHLRHGGDDAAAVLDDACGDEAHGSAA